MTILDRQGGLHLSRLAALTALCALLACGTAKADPLQDAARAYVTEDGFTEVTPEEVDALFDPLLGEGGGMLSAGKDVSAIEKALLAVDAREAPDRRLRYFLRYGERQIEGPRVSFVEVSRYNHGPAIHRDAVEAYGAENVADAESFGSGPHVAWRFVMLPSAKSAALLVAAGRREIGEAEAEAASCLGRSCLSPLTFDELALWPEGSELAPELIATAYPALVKAEASEGEAGEEFAPAYLALELARQAGLAQVEGEGILWTLPVPAEGAGESPFLAVVIDRNLGQEIMSDAALGLMPMGKEGQQSWTRISGGFWDGRPALWKTQYEGAMAPDHAEGEAE